VFYDEFAVYDRPSLYYAWAERNSKPEIPSNEKINLAEYEIHLLRLEHLHHLPSSVTIAEIEQKLESVKVLMNSDQILKTLKHIFALVPASIS
jgi:hypothetical protein